MVPLANLNMQTHYHAHIRFLLYLISPTHEWNRTFSNSEKVNNAKETWKASGNCTKQFNILYDYTKMKDIYATYHMVHRTHQHSPDIQSYYSNCVISMALAFLIHTHTHTHAHTHTEKKKKLSEGIFFHPLRWKTSKKTITLWTITLKWIPLSI